MHALEKNDMMKNLTFPPKYFCMSKNFLFTLRILARKAHHVCQCCCGLPIVPNPEILQSSIKAIMKIDINGSEGQKQAEVTKEK